MDAEDLADAFSVCADGVDVGVFRAWVCDEKAARRPSGSHVALELPEVKATRRIGGGVMGSRELTPVFLVAQRRALPCGGDEAPLEGLVFDESVGDTCPDLLGWDLTREGDFDGYQSARGAAARRSRGPCHCCYGCMVRGSRVRRF